jgi:hypothetical protein
VPAAAATRPPFSRYQSRLQWYVVLARPVLHRHGNRNINFNGKNIT